jgi:DNA-binding transcriptional ArsR family regulator
MENESRPEDEEIRPRIQGCDPWAVYSAKRFRKLAGLKGAQGLTEQQKAIYELIKSRGKLTFGELQDAVQLPPEEMRNQLAILRHCELVKARSEDRRVFLVPF